MTEVFFHGFGVATSLGLTVAETRDALFRAAPPRPSEPWRLLGGGVTLAAVLPEALANDLPGRTRTNRLVAHLVRQIRPAIDDVVARYGARRVAAIIGTSTTGIEEGVDPLHRRIAEGDWAEDYRFDDQELGDTARFLAEITRAAGPRMTISTACTSGAKALASAARMIGAGMIDAAVCGGADALSRLTLNGFSALDSVSPEACLPFSANRNGINIGEGGALFVLSREPSRWRLSGWGETSDAYHMSSPHPDGVWAEKAMRQAMTMAQISQDEVDFLHMHGTATRLNDAMEATLVNRVFGDATPCASTKGATGHTLGAAGAVQAALNLIAMEAGTYPPHVYDGAYDPALAPVRLTQCSETADAPLRHVLSASYAFGGSNIVLAMSGE